MREIKLTANHWLVELGKAFSKSSAGVIYFKFKNSIVI